MQPRVRCCSTFITETELRVKGVTNLLENVNELRALLCKSPVLERCDHYPEPKLQEKCAIIRPILSGICRTDLELLRGYSGFQGVLGHEFVGIVEDCSEPQWLGQRVVGEINWPCGCCSWCQSGGDRRHCAQRRALGIRHWDGCFAERFLMPLANLHRVPAEVPDRQAVFCEPLAAILAMCNILDARSDPQEEILGIGDGKLGLLAAQALSLAGYTLVWCVKHERSLDLLERWGIPSVIGKPGRTYSTILEMSGSQSGLQLAQEWLRPRGTLLVKSTVESQRTFDFNALVVKEWNISGSRCGDFGPALALLRTAQMDLEPLIRGCFPLEHAQRAFDVAGRPGSLKVLLTPYE